MVAVFSEVISTITFPAGSCCAVSSQMGNGATLPVGLWLARLEDVAPDGTQVDGRR